MFAEGSLATEKKNENAYRQELKEARGSLKLPFGLSYFTQEVNWVRGSGWTCPELAYQICRSLLRYT